MNQPKQKEKQFAEIQVTANKRTAEVRYGMRKEGK